MNPTVHPRRLPIDVLPRLFPLFQKGIRIEIETGCTLESLLCNRQGLSPENVQKRIGALFPDGKLVDGISPAGR